MSLDKAGLKVNLKTMYDATKVAAADGPTAEQNFINSLADAIETYVKSAQVNYTSGLIAGSNTVIGTFNGSLS